MPKPAPAKAPTCGGETPQTPLRHLYLVDGSGYIFRAYHALPPLTRSDGTPVGAVLGFTTMLLKLISETDADHIAVIFDAGRDTFRNQVYAEYKANRSEPPDELIPQFALIREATRACCVSCVELPGYEADDLIATYAKQAVARGAQVTIVSADKDLMQLVGDGITMLDPIKGRMIGPKEVEERFGVGPDKVVDVQALAGDSIDNVPGVPGIGVKTAAELIRTYGDLDNLLAHATEIKQPKRRESLIAHADAARLSRELVRLKDDVPVVEPLESFARREPDHERLLAFLRENQFRSLIKRYESRARIVADAGEGDATAGTAAPAARGRKAASTSAAAEHVLVQDEGALETWIAEASSEGLVALATFTGNPGTSRGDLVGFALCTRSGRACYVPLAHCAPRAQGSLDLDGAGSGETPRQVDAARALALLRPLLEDDGVLKIGHDIKVDLVVLGNLGLSVAPIDDVMLISYVLDGGSHSHDLVELSERHLGRTTTKLSDVTGTGKAQVTFDQVPLERACAYAAELVDTTLQLHRLLKPRLIEQRLLTVYETIERPLAAVVAGMERAGIKVDAAELSRLSTEFAARLGELEREIYRLAGHEFNIGSPKQLGEVLFDEMGLGSALSSGLAKKSSKTGAYATGADVLEELAAQGHELPARVLEWRQLSKLKSTYTDALLQEINSRTGRVHTCYALAATSTGRLSSTDPNLQNIPIRTEEGRKIRRAFIADKGKKLLSVDYSQIELRLAAHMADIAAMKEAFRSGVDIHALTASQVFGVPVEGMDPMVRRRAKAINFGIIYGISPFGLAAQLGISQGEAKAYIDAYFARYPGIRDYMERTKKIARETGYVTTLFGRRCYVPGINDKNPARRSFMERAAINAPLQGTAADIIKRAMIRVPPALEKARLRARMLLQVHDELLFEVPEAEVDKTAKLIKQVMENAIHPALELDVPLVAETGVGDNWAEAH